MPDVRWYRGNFRPFISHRFQVWTKIIISQLYQLILKQAKYLISLHILSMWETICDAQAGFCVNSKFLSKFSRTPLSGISDQSTAPPQMKTSDLSWPKFESEYPSPQMKTSDLSWPKFRSDYPPPPPQWRLQIWVDQSSDQTTPPPNEDFRFELTKVKIRVPPTPTTPPVAGGSFCMWRLIFIIRIIF